MSHWIIWINSEIAGIADLRLVPALKHLEDLYTDKNNEFKAAGVDVRVQNYERMEREVRQEIWRQWMGEDTLPQKGD